MESLHGEGWRKKLARLEAARGEGLSASPERPGDGGGVAVPAPAGTLRSQGASKDWGAGTGLREEALGRLGQSFAIRKVQGGPSSDPGNAQSAPEYRIAATAPERRAWSSAGSDFGGARGALVPTVTPAGMVLGGGVSAPPEGQPRPIVAPGSGVLPLVVSRMAHEIFMAGEPTESETTEECTERITQLGDELFAQGCEPEEVHFSQLSINYMRNLNEL